MLVLVLGMVVCVCVCVCCVILMSSSPRPKIIMAPIPHIRGFMTSDDTAPQIVSSNTS